VSRFHHERPRDGQPLKFSAGHLTGIVSMDDLLGMTPESTETVRTLPRIQRNWEREVRR
jgi:hypothetical protein